MAQLNHEFWLGLELDYPDQMKDYYHWIYHSHRLQWDNRINCGYVDLPDAMQFGIFLEYTSENGDMGFIVAVPKHDKYRSTIINYFKNYIA